MFFFFFFFLQWLNHMNFMVKRCLLGAILCWVTSYEMYVNKDKTYWKNSYWVNLSGFTTKRWSHVTCLLVHCSPVIMHVWTRAWDCPITCEGTWSIAFRSFSLFLILVSVLTLKYLILLDLRLLRNLEHSIGIKANSRRRMTTK